MIRTKIRPTMVVVGTGMAGAKVVEEVLARDADRFQIRLFGAEPHGTYNRILLSGVLGGHQDPRQLWLNSLDWYEDRGIHVHAGVRVETIDRKRQVVAGGGGKVEEPYDVLVLATGSRPFVPTLEGTRQQGVFVFRTLDDCAAISTYAQDCDRAVVLGGGLLGLEAARGLLSHGLEVTVVEVAPHLMVQQLDAVGGELLKSKLEAMGVRVLLKTVTTHILGENGRVCGLRFQDGGTMETDLIVIGCGIRPNVEEAKAAGLSVEKAIVVDDQLRTTDPSIFAVGECAQHRGRLYGLVDPVYEQARVLADVLTAAKPSASYTGSRLATTLKVMGVDLLSMGEASAPDVDCEVVSYLNPIRGIYKKLVLRDNRLIGAILLGESDPMQRLLRYFKTGEALEVEALDLLGCNARDALLHDSGIKKGQTKNKIEIIKEEKDGLDSLPDVLRLAPANNWQEMTEADKQRAKWHGLFHRTQTPGNFMMRLRFNAGRGTARQLRVLADLSDQYGKGFVDLTTRQQIQLRWFTLADVPDILLRLEEVGLHGKQTGMDNVRGVCGCPVSGLTPHELFDAAPVLRQFNDMLIGNKEFTNLPRKFNVTITGCMENCVHPETQDLGLAPAYRELDGEQVNGFNVLVGGKQGSGGYRPATPLDVFVRREDAAALCAEIARLFRDHGSRATRVRARLAFLIEDRGIGWFRNELERRRGRSLLRGGTDMRKKHHVDHLGIHPQKCHASDVGEPLYYVGCLVPVGRITTAQMRQIADVAERYGTGDVRMTTGQNLILVNIPESRLGAVTDEPIFKELPFDPSPILRGLVACTGTDYCGMALIETKGYALEVARELEKRTAGKKVLPLTIHWSGCSAGCGMHQIATIGLQGCRSRIGGHVVDAAHVCVRGAAGPKPVVATDLMYDVPVAKLADALEPLLLHLPR
ncbi:MAG: FAD-dependent oxidoreductase [Gemmataceae bacterium]